jgi:hypothetical protein
VAGGALAVGEHDDGIYGGDAGEGGGVVEEEELQRGQALLKKIVAAR